MPVPRRPKHPFFARIYDPLLARPADKWEAPYREELCREAKGLVLEIGAGTGMNFRHYGSTNRVVAVEPEPHMLQRARDRARSAQIPITVLAAAAERLPFADETFDSVVCSLVLCSVADQQAAISECRRVLRSRGALRLYEHVRSTNPRTARWQDRLERPWGLVGGGCHPNRDTLGALAAEGFEVASRRFKPPVPGGGFLPHVIGEARLASGRKAIGRPAGR
jgi:SAM-dependent methyltransferase